MSANNPTEIDFKKLLDAYLDAADKIAREGDFNRDTVTYCGILMLLNGLLDNVPRPLREGTLDAINQIIESAKADWQSSPTLH